MAKALQILRWAAILWTFGHGHIAMGGNAPMSPPAGAVTPTEEFRIEQGRVRGLVIGEKRDVHAYLGIPFAAPPVGELRWKPPQKPAGWEGVRDCFAYGPACPQKYSAMMHLVPFMAIDEFSEDCLFLNVFCPARPVKEKLPVMVWIHGGAYTMGAASQGIYDGQAIARHGVVLVTINYRLGPFGFCAHPALSAESENKVSGNYGILDQMESLRWVQRNIRAFGGDPDNVTIFGESAGGGSVICLMLAPQAKGLFHRAIAQSTPEMTLPHLNRAWKRRPAAEQQGKELIAACGLSANARAADMRNLSVETLVKVFPNLEIVNREPTLDATHLPIGPIVDGVVIPEDPNQAFAEGRFQRVPLMIGTTRDEAGLFLLLVRMPTQGGHYQKLVEREFAGLAEQVLESYPPVAEAKAIRTTVTHLLTDLVYGAQARWCARQSASLGQPTYKYLFSRAARGGPLSAAGAHHGCEVPFLFGVQSKSWSEWDRTLSESMIQYWVNFAATGDPNGAKLPHWPAYDRNREPTLELGDQITVIEKYRDRPLDTIDRYFREFPSVPAAGPTGK